MKVCNWDQWQTFRKDRGTPPWIKVYRNLLSNQEWVTLSDKEKGQLVSIWILAADKSGTIPDDPQIIMRMAMLDSKPNINKFKELGFLEPDGCQVVDSVASSGCQHDQPETETETETEERQSREEERQNGVVDVFSCWQETMNHPHAKLDGKREKKIKDAIKMGYSVDQLKRAIIGCSYSRWHMGENDRKKRFDSIDLIFRDADKIDGFIAQQPEGDPDDFLAGWDGTLRGVGSDNVVDGEIA